MNNLNNYIFSSLLICFTGFIMALIALFKVQDKKVAQKYILYNMAITFWGFCYFKMISSQTIAGGIFWSHTLHVGAIFIPVLFLHFSLEVLDKVQYRRTVLRIGYIIGFLLLALCPSHLFVLSAAPIFAFNYFIVPGKLYHLFTLFFWFYVLYTFYELFKGLKNSYDIKRNHVKYVLLAFIIGYTGGVTMFLPLFNINTPFWGPYLISFNVIVIAYATIKYKLLDINVVIRKTLVYSLLTALLFVVSVFVLFLLGRFFEQIFQQQKLLPMVLLVIILATLFQPLYRWSTIQIERLFFKGTLPEVSKEKERIEEELRRSERLASLGMLASGLVHEIKNPLTPIKMKIKQLPSYLNEDQKNTDFFRKFNTAIPYEIDRIVGILGQLKEFAKPSTLETNQVNIIQVLNNRLVLLEEVMKQRGIELRKKYECPNPIIPADPNKLGQVFLNLFQNAIEAMHHGGILTISCESDTLHGSNSDAILIKVQDTGFGIPKEDLPYIFDPFFSKKKSGTGLGLAITHQIIKNHGGMIQVESLQGKGSTFYIHFPLNTQKNYLLDRK